MSERVSTQSLPSTSRQLSAKQKERMLAQMRPQVRVTCEEVIKKDDAYERATLVHYYDLGGHMQAAMSTSTDPEKEMQLIALVTGKSIAWLRRMMMFRARVPEGEFYGKLLGNPASGTRLVPFSSISEVLKVKDDALFWKMIERISADGLSLRDVREELHGRRKLNGRGKGSPRPRTLTGALAQVSAIGRSLVDRLKDKALFRNVDHLKPEAANADTLKKMQASEELLYGLAEQARARADEIKQARLRVSGETSAPELRDKHRRPVPENV